MQNVFLTFIMKQYIMQSLHSGALIKGGETKRKRLFGRRAWFTQNTCLLALPCFISKAPSPPTKRNQNRDLCKFYRAPIFFTLC